MRGTCTAALFTVAATFFLAAPTHADALTAYRKYKGQIIVTEAPLSLADDDAVAKIKKLNRTTLQRAEGQESWPFFLIGFLTKRPEATPINLVFYDLADGKREYVGNQEMNIDREATIVVSDIAASEDDGLKAGKTYEVLLARKVDGKEIVYAKTKLTFK